LDRATALAYLTEEFAELAVNAKFDANATANAYNTAIDNSLRKLGFVETDLLTAVVQQTDIQKFIKLLEYFSLKRFSRLLSLRFDAKVGNGAVEATRSQAFKQVERLVQESVNELAVLGVIVGGSNFFEMGRIELDLNEPKTLAEF